MHALPPPPPPGTDAPRVSAAPKQPTPQGGTVTMQLDAETLRQLDALIPEVAGSEAARQFGIEVDRGVVLRIAVMRGLAVMATGLASPRPIEPQGKNAAQGKSAGPKPPAPPEPTGLAPNGLHPIPEGWNVWAEAERVPGHHAAAHDYYTSHGWTRFYGIVGEDGKGRETIAFYWCNDPTGQDVPVLEGAVIQKTPWGPGHILPAEFGGGA